MTSQPGVRMCPQCAAEIGPGETVCPSCRALISVGQATIRVEGRDASEVERVARGLVSDQRDAERRAAAQLRSPWATGMFYVFVLVVVAAILLTAASIVPIWALPTIAIGSFIGVAIVGAFQLRHDDRLSEQGFLQLMALTIKRFPLLARTPSKTTHS